MKKQLKSIPILVSVLLVLVIILGVLLVDYSDKNTGEEAVLGENTGTLSELRGNLGTNDLFSGINEPHYENMPITYALKQEECGAVMTKRIKQAFDTISNETDKVIIFEDVSDTNPTEADIVIHCYRELEENNGLYTAGEALYSVKGGSNPNLIESSEINFYKVNPDANNQFSGGCTGYPNTEIHEILHTFGFEHKNGYSIMNPISDGCRITMIEKEITDKLKEIYS